MTYINITLFISICFIVFKVLCDFDSNYILERRDKNSIKTYWNIPTFQCDSSKLNFSSLAEKYNIIQNTDGRFWGNNITILYDVGAFPAILTNKSKTYYRNGGIPQRGNLTLHLELFEFMVDKLIPDKNFPGVGIIDFESWRPIFRQNFGVLSEYKNLSIIYEKQNHPFWPDSWIEKEATQRFEFSGRKFMEETLIFAKKIRPYASWGYYAYPYCFNNFQTKIECPKEVMKENDRTAWLFEKSDNLYPSLYLPQLNTNSENKIQTVENRINEAYRVLSETPEKQIKVMPYFWYKYHDTKEFVSKSDLFNIFTVLAASKIDGLILWGSSSDVDNKKKCLSLYEYIDEILGPMLYRNLY